MERVGTDETDRRLHQTVGLVVVIGAGFLSWSAWNLVRTGTWAQPPSWLWLGCFAVMLTLANTLVLEVRIKSSQHQMMMSETVMMLGLMLLTSKGAAGVTGGPADGGATVEAHEANGRYPAAAPSIIAPGSTTIRCAAGAARSRC